VRFRGRAGGRGGLAAEDEMIDVVARLAPYDMLAPVAPAPANVVVAQWTTEVVEVDMWPGSSLAHRWAGRVHALPAAATPAAAAAVAGEATATPAAAEVEEAVAELWAVAELRAVAG
jgi:hypothetical protein